MKTVFWEKLLDKSQAPISEEDCAIQTMIKLIEAQQLRCFTRKAYFVSYLGLLATVVSEDAVYWESSEGFGSGASGNIEAGSMVIIDMVSYLDEDGSISNVSYLKDSSLDINFSQMHMLHISSNGKDLGWICPRDLIV